MRTIEKEGICYIVDHDELAILRLALTVIDHHTKIVFRIKFLWLSQTFTNFTKHTCLYEKCIYRAISQYIQYIYISHPLPKNIGYSPLLAFEHDFFVFSFSYFYCFVFCFLFFFR